MIAAQPICWHAHEKGADLVVLHGHKLTEHEQQHEHPHEGLGPVVAFTETEVQV